MDISGIRQNIAVEKSQYSQYNTNAISNFKSSGISSDNTVTEPEKVHIDMRNISPDEYSELVRSGIADIPVPMILPDGQYHLDGKQSDLSNKKVDYIGQIEKSIEFSKSIGDHKSVDFLTGRLDQVKKLHGLEYIPIQDSKGIDVAV
ncbi:hypothetical protein SAMN05660691_03420 [Rheinheimera pacifica]|uniref:Uncharacterized protein n=1 Tax=Rheinheimera pacifica TaxID=173990 RepID=A0A1H6N0G7_9GAMM|nr:hypothetical protein [Rheinheimera pacifica]SEI08005.1 hypothetical protein SAMN05660691_03420 [Rheinheimera pacifica]